MTPFPLAACPAWAQMWTMAIAVYAVCKSLTWRHAAIADAPSWKHAAYLLAWPGLDAPGFLGPRQTPHCRRAEWLAAAGRFTLGVVLMVAVAPVVPQQHPYVVGWIGMIGFVLILHFGIFHLLSCSWRSVGIHARPLMDRPLASTSLSEFWGRWNTAFRDLANRFLFRPGASWFGPRWGVVAAFLFSGAVHDLVISVPAGGGYGGPTAFFAIQGAAVMIERSSFGRQLGLGSGWPGRMFAIAVLVAPVQLLFHRPFVEGVIVPFMRAMGAI